MYQLNIQVTQVESIVKRHTAIVKPFHKFLSDNILSHKATIDLIRANNEKEVIDRLKATLPACQFSESNGRGVEGIEKVSDIMQIDIDGKDNPGIKDLKGAISEIPYILFAMHSASGKGVFALIRIADPIRFKEHFAAFKSYIERTYQIAIDKAVSSPASLRYWSYDPEPVINPTAEVWSYVPKPVVRKEYKPHVSSDQGNVFDDFNVNGEIESLLISHGWTYQHSKGSRKRYSRPGKTNGISADYCTERKLLYVFSGDAATGMNDANKAFNHISVFCQLECANDWKACANKLKMLGYGLK